jgi:hypothetical protein
MSISGDYPQPVTVNGFSCRNCTDVDYAKKHIDPAHPKSGPYGLNAERDPTRDRAVILDGRLGALAATQRTDVVASDRPGAQVDVRA